MDINLTISIIVGLVALALGIGAGKLIFAKNTALRVQEAEQQAEKLLSDARSRAATFKREKELEAKEKLVHLKYEHAIETL